jgi:hypothetical protein
VCNHGGHNEVALPAQLNPRPTRRDATSGVDRRPFVAARRQSRSLAGRVDAAHLRGHGGDPGQAQHQHHDERGDGQRRLDGARAGTAG